MWRRYGAAVWGVAFSLVGFVVGFVNDDLLQRLWLEHRIPDYDVAPYSLYEFTGPRSRDWLVWHEHAPWFTDPSWSLRFFRPLSSLSLAADHALFGRNALFAHLHSLVWFVLLAVAATALLRRLLPGRAGTLASLVYVLASGQAMSVAWLASRHSLVGGALGALALLWHVHRRKGGFRAGAWLAPLSLAVGLTASEVALGAGIFIATYELVAPREPLAVRARAALPALLVMVAYLGFYAGAGYGARGSAAYISPFSAPGAYVGAALLRVPALAAELYAAVPSMLSGAFSIRGQTVLAALGVLATLGSLALLQRWRSARPPELQRQLWFLALGSLLSLLPMAGGFVGGRMLPIASIGAAGVIGALLDTALERRARLLSFALIAPHLLLAPFVRLALPLVFLQMERGERKLAKTAEIDRCSPGSTAYVLTGSDPTLALYAGISLGFFEPTRAARLQNVVPLSMAPNDQRLTRLSADSFELTTRGPRALAPFEAVYRQAPFVGGEHVRTSALEADVLEVASGMPTRVRFRFYTGAEHACLLRWQQGALRHVVLRPGEALELPHEPGPNGF